MTHRLILLMVAIVAIVEPAPAQSARTKSIGYAVREGRMVEMPVRLTDTDARKTEASDTPTISPDDADEGAAPVRKARISRPKPMAPRVIASSSSQTMPSTGDPA